MTGGNCMKYDMPENCITSLIFICTLERVIRVKHLYVELQCFNDTTVSRGYTSGYLLPPTG